MIQKYKAVTSNGSEVFFFDHSFKSALSHALAFAAKTSSKLFYRNFKEFGSTWLPYKSS